MNKPAAEGKPQTRRHQKTLAVGGILQKRLENMGMAQGVVIAKLLTHWQAVCPLLAHVTQPLSCIKGNLKVATASDSVKQELRYHAPATIALINQLLGFEGVNKITAVTQPLMPVVSHQKTAKSQGPTPPTSLASSTEACKGVADPDLREALAKLGQWFAK